MMLLVPGSVLQHNLHGYNLQINTHVNSIPDFEQEIKYQYSNNIILVINKAKSD